VSEFTQEQQEKQQKLMEELRRQQERMTRNVLEELQDRYHQSFEITRIIADVGDMSVKMYLKSADLPSVPFTVHLGASEGFSEDFIPSGILASLCRKIESAIPGSAVCGRFVEEDPAEETDPDLSMEEYLRKHTVLGIHLYILIAGNYEESVQEILSGMKEISMSCDTELVFRVWHMDKESFESAGQLFRVIPFVSRDILDSYPFLQTWSAIVRAGAVMHFSPQEKQEGDSNGLY